MKTVHNVRVRVHHTDETFVNAIIDRAEQLARRRDEDRITRSVKREEGLVGGELWLDHQGPVRAFVKALREAVGMAVRENSSRYLDTGTHCYLFLDAEEFVRGNVVLVTKPNGAIAVRLNIACWPATRENAVKTLRDIFS
jgi:RNA binding exosome subunit